MSSPTQRSLKHLREKYPHVGIVERWIAQARKRSDLFGIFDIVAVGDGKTVGVQTTSGSNVAARIRKIQDSEALPELREAGWVILVHGWRKNSKGRWVLREVDIS